MNIAEHFRRQRFAAVNEIRPKPPRVVDIRVGGMNCSGAFGKSAHSSSRWQALRVHVVSDLVVITVTMPIYDCLKERATCSEA
ncbi:hypothetical protein C5612_15745 [Pseudomonas frederiksbergensis]|uniref:Uncharacterized protein n=1 Tax=Pseudomonas frederiksbergensis TaxID=104087 RepID=A0A2S8HL89_9PSED|nr:hypothetical protein C5612_15745 [Pseudomonas frederiksbergensis]